jgi:hypothetical protein
MTAPRFDARPLAALNLIAVRRRSRVRNAIQLLEFLLAQPAVAGQERVELAAVTRRLWLALWEIERPGPTDRRSR